MPIDCALKIQWALLEKGVAMIPVNPSSLKAEIAQIDEKTAVDSSDY